MTRPPQIFISYRRKETTAYAHLLKDKLGERFGDSAIFQDIHSIHLGIDFRKEITEAVASCKVLIAVIGPKWQERLDEKKSQPLEASDDFVRLEIAAALQRGIPVVPLLLPDAAMPDRDKLPPDLKDLVYRHAMDIRDVSWEEDVGRLAEKLKPHVKSEEVPPPPAQDWRTILIIVGVLALVTVVGLMSIRYLPTGENTNANRSTNNPVITQPSPTDGPAPTPTAAPEGETPNPISNLEGTAWSGESVVNSASVKYRIVFMKNDRVDWTISEPSSSETLMGNYKQSQAQVTMTFNKVKPGGRASQPINMGIELTGTATGDFIKGTGKNSDGFAWTWSVQKETQ
jgi:hypothetical protein